MCGSILPCEWVLCIQQLAFATGRLTADQIFMKLEELMVVVEAVQMMQQHMFSAAS